MVPCGTEMPHFMNKAARMQLIPVDGTRNPESTLG